MLCALMCCRVIWCHVISFVCCYTMSCHVVLCRVTWWYVPCHVMSCHVMLSTSASSPPLPSHSCLRPPGIFFDNFVVAHSLKEAFGFADATYTLKAAGNALSNAPSCPPLPWPHHSFPILPSYTPSFIPILPFPWLILYRQSFTLSLC